MSFILSNVRALLPDGSIERGSLVIERGRIAAVESRHLGGVDCGGLLALPGMVDLHGDALERQLMPRPGVAFPPGQALIDTDRQLLANGITTAYHALTLSWEPGLRSVAYLTEIIDALDAARPLLSADTRLHLRFEVLALACAETVLGWIAEGRIHCLSFNDHSRDIAQHRREGKLATYLGRTGLSELEFLAAFDAALAARLEVPSALGVVAHRAASAGIPLASHDDATAEQRSFYRRRFCAIAEFPINAETAADAIACGEASVLGAPNVVRGGSHVGRIDATGAVADGLCTILTSDYYYPALLQAPFTLAAKGVLPLGPAWDLVAKNPAAALRLDDRGTLAPGRRADLLLVEDRDTLPMVAASFVAGAPAFVAGMLAPELIALRARRAALAAE